ncbi:MAG: serine--tRNA ligase, partial [Elusimicrobia bacterium]|nr:serine--tRNA ligase [Elusimicrobiota bacterium]
SFSEINQTVNDALLRLPNFVHESVPKGKDSNDNQMLREEGKKREFPFEPKFHWEIGEKLGILDFVTAGKISGSRFSLLKGAGAALERALISFMLDLHTQEHGYTEVYPPYLVKTEAMQGTGQLPKFEEELFRIERDQLYLIPTAEVSVTNMHRDFVFDEKELPKKYVCYSACFRREAGSYGKDTKGLIRNHQFNKVEMVWFAAPDHSFADLEKLTQDAETVLKKLGIPYRVVSLCGGDIGFASAKTYDLEVWMPGEKRWREISSCSCFTDFQARRMNIKYKNSAGKKELAHTLNGSGVAVGRLFASILENYQESDGSVTIPEILKPYLKMEKIGS